MGGNLIFVSAIHAGTLVTSSFSSASLCALRISWFGFSAPGLGLGLGLVAHDGGWVGLGLEAGVGLAGLGLIRRGGSVLAGWSSLDIGRVNGLSSNGDFLGVFCHNNKQSQTMINICIWA